MLEIHKAVQSDALRDGLQSYYIQITMRRIEAALMQVAALLRNESPDRSEDLQEGAHARSIFGSSKPHHWRVEQHEKDRSHLKCHIL